MTGGVSLCYSILRSNSADTMWESEILKWLGERDPVLSSIVAVFLGIMVLLEKWQNWRGTPEFRAVVQQLDRLNTALLAHLGGGNVAVVDQIRNLNTTLSGQLRKMNEAILELAKQGR